MDTQTDLANAIDVTDNGAKYDSEVKHLLSQKPILSRILHECVEEFYDMTIDDIEKSIEGTPSVEDIPVDRDVYIQESNTEDSSVTDGVVRFDIIFNAEIHGKKQNFNLIINIEAQNDFYPGYQPVIRSIYYASRMISRQKNTVFLNTDYGKLRKVYSIWIFHDPSDEMAGGITEYHMVEKPIIGNSLMKTKDYDLINIVHIYLTSYEKRDKSLVGMLTTLLSVDISKEEKKESLSNTYNLKMTKELERRVDDMCNLSQGVLQKGKTLGKEDMLFDLVNSGDIDINVAAKKLDVPVAEFKIKMQKAGYKA